MQHLSVKLFLKDEIYNKILILHRLNSPVVTFQASHDASGIRNLKIFLSNFYTFHADNVVSRLAELLTTHLSEKKNFNNHKFLEGLLNIISVSTFIITREKYSSNMVSNTVLIN